MREQCGTQLRAHPVPCQPLHPGCARSCRGAAPAPALPPSPILPALLADPGAKTKRWRQMPNHFQAHDRALSHPEWSSAPRMGSPYKSAVAAATLIHPHAGGQRGDVRDAGRIALICRDLRALPCGPLWWGLLWRRGSVLELGAALTDPELPRTEQEGDLTELPLLSGPTSDFSTRPLEASKSQLGCSSHPV